MGLKIHLPEPVVMCATGENCVFGGFRRLRIPGRAEGAACIPGRPGLGVGKLGLRVDSRANPRSKFYCQLPFTEQLLSKPVEVSEL